jgi:hypothetical protein
MNPTIFQEVKSSLWSLIRTHSYFRYLTVNQCYILHEISFLALAHGLNNPSRAIYCVPSEKYLAKKIGTCRETVSRNIQILKEMKLLNVVRRRKENGYWKTNLYKFGAVLWTIVKGITDCFLKKFNHVTQMSHIVSDTITKYLKKTKKEFDSINDKDKIGRMPWDTFFERHPELK